MSKNDEQLTGDDAYRAARDEVAKRNDAARKKGAALRSANEAKRMQKRQAAARQEMANLPEQPRPE